MGHSITVVHTVETKDLLPVAVVQSYIVLMVVVMALPVRLMENIINYQVVISLRLKEKEQGNNYRDMREEDSFI